MVRAPCCEKMGLKKGPWKPEEDQILISHIQRYGHGNWRALPKQAGLLRCGKSCRLRWTNYLRPDIKRGNFSKEEEEAIIKLHQIIGNRWSAIAARLPGRTDNEIKNFWNSHLKKRVKQSSTLATPTTMIKHYSINTLNTDITRSHHGDAPSILPQHPQKLLSFDPSMATTIHPIKAESNESSQSFSTIDSPADSTKETMNNSISIINDERDFWYNLFMKAGELSQPHRNLGQFG